MDTDTFQTMCSAHISSENYILNILEDMRMDIWKFMCERKYKLENEDILEENREYFDITKYVNLIGNEIDIVIEELRTIGWSVEKSFGDSAIFIFKGPKPENCY